MKEFDTVEKTPGSGLGAYSGNNQMQIDFDMVNHITMGQNRKLKKKMKKLQKNSEDPTTIFNDIQKYKESLYRVHEKKIFNNVNELQQRRDKRMKKMEMNKKKSKK